MLQAYMDDSGTGQGTVFVLASFMSTAEQWVSFSDDWDAELKRDPPINFFKMKEAMDCRGEFSPISFVDRNRKYKRLVSIIDDYAVAKFAAVVDVVAFSRVFGARVGKLFRTPYYVAFYGIVELIVDFLAFANDAREVRLIFDEQGKQMDRALDVWKHWQDHAPDAWTKRIPDPPISGNDKKDMPLQAADMLAWLLRRELLNEKDNSRHPEFKMPACHGLVSVWNEERLERFSESLRTNSHPLAPYLGAV